MLEDTQLSSTLLPESTRKCKACRQKKPIDLFAFLVRRPRRGQDRAAACTTCTAKNKGWKKAHVEEEKENGSVPTNKFKPSRESLEPCVFKDLVEWKNVVELEARVYITCLDLGLECEYCRKRADAVAREISNTMEYHFTYHSMNEHKKNISATCFSYHCMQNKDWKKISKKCDDPTKQRDTLSMLAFDCNGWLHVTVEDGNRHAHIKVQHKDDHVPYSVISLPDDVKRLIMTRAVHNAWSTLNQVDWKQDEDQLKSAIKLLEEAQTKGGLGIYRAEHISLPTGDGFTALAWSLPDMLLQWGGRIHEAALDSAWETNRSRFELYMLIGEAYGTGLPLGFLFLSSSGGASGGLQRHITPFLDHIQTKWALKIMVGLSEKNRPEINSCCVTISICKHQLCFWHDVTALRKRLSTLCRMPAYYDVDQAQAEFSWIDAHFVPIAQCKALADRTNLNGSLPTNSEDLEDWDEIVEDGELESMWEEMEADLNEDEDQRMGQTGCSKMVKSDLLIHCTHFALHPTATKSCVSTRNIFVSTLFFWIAEVTTLPLKSESRQCTRCTHFVSLMASEVWGYLWMSWYQPKMWVLWAHSSSPYLPRWCTTMSVENFWCQLKHDYLLHHLLQPHLDQLVHLIWAICSITLCS
ncbi:hypothetical protein K439DRAFT_1547853 [Ramaria rubella]|nr:hypothetical protein K439DRAFT_1547853 [Ramaria rubella]